MSNSDMVFAPNNSHITSIFLSITHLLQHSATVHMYTLWDVTSMWFLPPHVFQQLQQEILQKVEYDVHPNQLV